MKNRKMLLQVLLCAAFVLSLVVPAAVAGASGGGLLPDECRASYSATDSSSAAWEVSLNTPESEVTPMVAAGSGHTVGLACGGAVVAVGGNRYGQCDVRGWTGITQVSAGCLSTVGLKSDGTVVITGCDGYQSNYKCDVGGWTDIAQVAAGCGQVVGLKSDGTVVAVGSDDSGKCDVGDWTDIVQIAASSGHTVGIMSDGTVVAVGSNSSEQCHIDNWTDIMQVAAGGSHTVGLKSDGTVAAVGNNYSGQCDVGGWTDIVQVTAGRSHTVGLRSDGTVVAVGSNQYGKCDVDNWTDIVQVAAGWRHTVGLKSDGTAVAVGPEGGEWDEGQCDVDNWNLLSGVPLMNWPLLGGTIGALVALGLVIFLVSRRRSVRMGFGGKIWGFLRRPATTFRAVKEETLGSALKYALIGLAIFAVFTGMVLALQGIDESSIYIPRAVVGSIIGGMLFIFIGGAWTNLWVYLLAGRKSHGYRQTVKALAYGGTPVYLIGWLFLLGVLAEDSFGPPVLSSILIGLGALVLIWALVVTTIGLGELHGVTGRRAAATLASAIVVAALVTSVVATVLYLVLGAWAVLSWLVRM